MQAKVTIEMNTLKTPAAKKTAARLHAGTKDIKAATIEDTTMPRQNVSG